MRGVLVTDLAGLQVDEPSHRELRRDPDEARVVERAKHPIPAGRGDSVVEMGIGEVVIEMVPPDQLRVPPLARMGLRAAVNDVLEKGPGKGAQEQSGEDGAGHGRLDGLDSTPGGCR